MIKLRISICCCLMAILLSGCWDTIDIENRGFVIGVAIDEPKEKADHGEAFLLTNQIVVPSQMAGQESAGGGGGRKAFYNLTREGKSVYQTTEEFAGSSSKVPYYEHLMLILLSKEVAEQEQTISKALDSFIRSPHVRRNIKVIITEDSALDMLDFETQDEPLPAMHLHQLLIQSNEQAGFFSSRNLGEIDELLLINRSFALPLLTKQKDYVDYHSVAIYQGDQKKIVGTFNKEEKTGLDFFRDDADAHIFTFDYQGESVSFRVIKQTNRLQLDVKDINHIQAKMNIELEGGVRELYPQIDFNDKKTLKKVEKAASKKVEQMVGKAIEKGQKELNADIFNIWRVLESKHYDTWEKVRDDWEKGENYFSNVSFEVDVEIELNSTGTSNKTD